MTLTQDILTGAYARSTANDPGKLATDTELMSRSNRVYQSLYAAAARARPDSYSAALAVLLAGVPATAALLPDLIELRRVLNAAGQTVHVIPERDALRGWHIGPCIFQRGLIVVSRNLATDPQPGDTLTLTVLDAPAPLTSLSTPLDQRFPTRHHEVLICDLALYLDAKDEGRDQVAYGKLAADYNQRLSTFAAEYDLDVSALEFVHSTAERVPVTTGSGQ